MITIYNLAVVVASLATLSLFLVSVKKDAKKGISDLKRHNEVKKRIVEERERSESEAGVKHRELSAYGAGD